MPKLSKRLPKYRCHKPTNQAYVELNKKRYYLGPYGSQKSRLEYDRLIGEYLSTARMAVDASHCQEMDMGQLCVRFREFAAGYYLKNGKPTSELRSYDTVIRSLLATYLHTQASEFGPLALRAVRDQWVEAGYSRNVCNQMHRRVVRIFRWATEHELVDVTVWQRLKAVQTLKKGRTTAREKIPIPPVDLDRVAATIPHLSPVVQGMIRLQLATGMRPGEVCMMRKRDVDTSGDVWEYRPESHKTEHHGHDRVIYLGPQAQEALRPFLLRPDDSHCFSAAESIEYFRRMREQARKTPAHHGNRRGKRLQPRERSANPRQPRDHFDSSSYAKAIARGCKKAWPAPDELVDPAEIKAWNDEYRWAPNQLRHTKGTQIRKLYGLESAQVILGHSNAKVTEVYAERDAERARKVAAEIG
ncbi:tyrosine-type recombinase/integrase [Roseiconus lacunae]|uniref:Site-specific integrase n=1 Tax=Roseiconus lacunae TaxID=2605694 RepID=A0ABT7PHS9_9BACT|nr:site-specific integrase [Roseiconus lacunae]MDM4015806.1 site-specific integrase [Roseiconus lacunae]